MRKLLIFLLILIPVCAYAHSWYDPYCCSENDCVQTLCTDLIRNGQGYLYKGTQFTKDMIKLSQDNFCHICISSTGTPRCLYLPTGA